MAGDGDLKALGTVAKVRSGYAFKSQDMGQTGSPIVKIKNVVPPTIDITDCERVPSDAIANAPNIDRYIIEAGDILIAMTGATVGKVGRFPPAKERFYLNQRVGKVYLTEPDIADYRYIYFVLSQDEYVRQMFGVADGSAQANISGIQIERLEIPLPPLAEQRAIAHILGTLDDKIELNWRMNETLEAMARALFKSWFVDFDPVRAKAEGRDPGLPQPLTDLFPDSFDDSELGEVPKGWRVLELAECVDVDRGLSYKGSGLSDSGLPMHNLNSIYEGGGYKDEGIKHYEGHYALRHIARAGDLIVANTEQGHKRLLIGYAAIVPTRFGGESLFSHHIYRVRPRSSSGLTPDYLCHLLNTSVIHDTVSGYANGTTVNMLPIDALRSPLVVVPPSIIVRAFDGFAEAARKHHDEMMDEGHTLSALRDILLPKLISGELRVSDAETIVRDSVA
jgi:type I restriction enzyme, S subunit